MMTTLVDKETPMTGREDSRTVQVMMEKYSQLVSHFIVPLELSGHGSCPCRVE